MKKDKYKEGCDCRISRVTKEEINMTGKEGKKEEGEHKKKKGKSFDSFFP